MGWRAMARILLVSKPLAPPWNDSSKNLARDVAEGMRTHTPIAMGDGTWAPARGTIEPIYSSAGRFTPAFSAQLRVLARLIAGSRADVWHFFFAPNPKSSAAARACAKIRRVHTVQTVCSRPRQLERARSLLFAHRTVALSRATFDGLRDAGVPETRLAHIPPAVPALEIPSDAERDAARDALDLPRGAPLVVFPGDLELGEGAARAIGAFALVRDREAILAMACRPKTPGARAAERDLGERARSLGIADRTRWLGETRKIHALLGAADVVLLPSSDLYAKMDLPLVLIEAMWLARPVIVAARSPAAELADGGSAIAVDPTEEAIAERIDDLIGSDAARAELGSSARRAAQERFAPARMAEAYETLYDRLLEEER
jgi:glycosyltransferase involved in cell wall biosynthesis